jgi:tryptophan-rich sensory protein
MEWLSLLVAIAVPLLGGIGSSWISMDGFRGAWYAALAKPAWQPPAWLFGPVWTTLYVLMGVASWFLWRAPVSAARTLALALYTVQLVLNFAWSPTFNGRRLRAASYILAALCAVLSGLIGVAFAVNAWAGALLLPYLAWCAFAAALNFEIVRLNVKK